VYVGVVFKACLRVVLKCTKEDFRRWKETQFIKNVLAMEATASVRWHFHMLFLYTRVCVGSWW